MPRLCSTYALLLRESLQESPGRQSLTPITKSHLRLPCFALPVSRGLSQIIEGPQTPRRPKEEVENHADYRGIETPDRSKLQPPHHHHHHQPCNIEPPKHHQ